MVNRFATVVLLSSALVVSGLGIAPADGDVIPPTVAEHLAGLPAEDPNGVEQPVQAQGTDAVTGAPAVRSEKVQTPLPFSMVGFEIPAGSTLGFRTSVDGHEWSPWQSAPAMDADHRPDEGSPEAAAAAPEGTRTEGHWVGEAAWLQVRVGGGRTEDVGIDLIDSLGLSRSLPERAADAVRSAMRPAPQPAAAAPARPDVVTRKEWGADESLRDGDPRYASQARMGVVHHTATPNTYTREEAPGVVRAIYRYHTESNGWDDIGYNLLVDRFGTVYEGRYGGLESAVIGAHAAGWNTGSFGVSVLGCFDSESCAGVAGGPASLPAAVEEALVELLAWKLDVHSIDVEGTVSMNGSTKPTLLGHRDVGSTSCPGDALAARLGDIKEAVAELQEALGGVVVAPAASPTTVELEDGRLGRDVTLSAGLRPPGVWELTVTDEDDRVVHTATGAGASASVEWTGGSGLRPGDYTVAFSSIHRRTAQTTLEVEAPCEDAFCDLGDSVHAEAILRLHVRGVVTGCADGRFCPSGRVTRGQMATMTARALELTPTAGGHFDDVPADHPHADGINALYEHGIVQGDDGAFWPNREVRRDQMATFLRNGLDLEASGATHFSDVAGNVHGTAINALADHGVTRGDGNGRYLPARPIRRDQIASLIDRALRVSP